MSEYAPTGPVVLSLTIGTAGHIDHGKTSLVKCLTGHDPDTLPEERARGMTINLGFAAMMLADGRRVGLVDVPGHERFLHNMLAGATGIDLVLLVIAADDGVMPQTIGHFHVIRLLEIASGIIVITKTDLVEPARVAEVAAEARRLVAGSLLEKAPVVAVSARTGTGMGDLRAAITGLADRHVRREAGGPFRMPVERVMPIKGIGAVVAGVPRSGSIRIGDAVELLPAGGVKKVKGIRFFDQDVDVGLPGQLLALRVSDLSCREVRRGMLVATPGYFRSARLLNARFVAMPQLDRPIAQHTPIRLHLGTAEMSGRLVLPSPEGLDAGQESYVQFQLDEPVVTAPGECFLVRVPGRAQIIGGGSIVSADTRRLRLRYGNWRETVREQDRARHDPGAALLLALRQGGAVPATPAELARRALLDETVVRNHLDGLVKSGSAVDCGSGRYISATALAEVCSAVVAVLNRLHSADPLAVGFPKATVFNALQMPSLTLAKACATLLCDGRIIQNAVGWQIPGRAPQLSHAKARIATRIDELYKAAQFVTPRIEELPAIVGAPGTVIDPVLRYLLQAGVLVRVDAVVILHRENIEECRRRLTEWLVARGSIDAGGFRDMLGTTRKYAIPLLEYWDRQGLTRREGDVRKLKDPSR